MSGSEPPLVSVIVRSMGRPELEAALASIAAQDYPSIETIVVDATGGGHPPLPPQPRPPGHVVRLIGGERRLLRAAAANAGLLAARGAWLCFLDDDDTYDSHFVSAMVEAAAGHPQALLVYGSTKVVGADGKVARVVGRPFNRAIMHHGPLFCWPAALIRRDVVDLGCRLDEALDVCEDRDFVAQIARHSDLAFVPVTAFNYRQHLGTSGTNQVNKDVANSARFERLLRAKGAGEGAYHTWRAARQCVRAIDAYLAGDRGRSRAVFEALLRDYPDDPNALNGLARIELECGYPDLAAGLIDRAIDLRPTVAEYRLTRAMILERLGRHREAAAEARQAAATPELKARAEELLRRLPPHVEAGAPARVFADTEVAPNRLGLCGCGSGKRYKHCCGRLPPPPPAPTSAERAVVQAVAWSSRGEACRAKALVDTLDPAAIGDADLARSAAEICIELAAYEQAYGFLDRSVKLRRTERTERVLQECCEGIWRERTARSAHAMVLRLREHIAQRAPAAHSSDSRTIHVLGPLGASGRFAEHALAVYRLLSPHADVRLWSTAAPAASPQPALPVRVLDPQRGVLPTGGTLILSGHHLETGDWWCQAALDRVVIWLSDDLPIELVHRLADVEETTRAARVELTFSSRMARDRSGLPGDVEYPLVDAALLVETATARSDRGSLVVGRHSDDDRLLHHPNDPALYRTLIARGHRLRLLGATCLRAAFSGDPPTPALELLAGGSVATHAFLQSLDCLVFRTHPQRAECGGEWVLEAMAIGVPVIVFRQGVGAAELIDHGRDGFVVETETEALACLDELAAHPPLRAAIGAAARRKVAALQQAQRARMLARYLGTTPPAAQPDEDAGQSDRIASPLVGSASTTNLPLPTLRAGSITPACTTPSVAGSEPSAVETR